ncbi:nadp-dependent malic enzyme [Quercus suber]|uniref:Nadp-dependent malic enzyme n=1 Tax=Quercus suber TaxID=58331 RepID=A0AAW0LZN5_QUESU
MSYWNIFNSFHIEPGQPKDVKQQHDEELMQKIRQIQVPLQKYIALMELQERNEGLFYKLIIDNIEELLPVVYSPIVSKACEACQKNGASSSILRIFT